MRDPRCRVNSPQNPSGVVYYLRLGDLIKVGFTVDLAARLRDYPPHAHVLATEPGTKTLERQRHHELRHSLNLGREWFARSDEVLAHIESVLAEYGEPVVVGKSKNQHHYPVTVTRINA